MALTVPCRLTPSGLHHIAHHQYRAGEYSPLDRAFTPWWNGAIRFVPWTVAPNVITLLGTLAVVAGAWVHVGLLTVPGADGTLQAPAWSYAGVAVAMFVYQTMDALDGKQARRTGSSSPLGQLFDHGCDALVTPIVMYLTAFALGMGHTVHTAALVATSMTLFFLAQWEEAVTGVLRTNVSGFGVTESQVYFMLVQLARAALPTGCMFAPLAVTVTLGSYFSWSPAAISLGHAIAYITYLIMGVGLAGFLWHGCLSTPTRWHRIITAMPSLLNAACVIALFATANPAATIHPVLVLVVYAACQLEMTSRTVVYGMGQQAMPLVTPAAMIMPVLTVVAMRLPAASLHALGFALPASILLYGAFVYTALHQIAGHLHIPILAMPATAHTQPVHTESHRHHDHSHGDGADGGALTTSGMAHDAGAAPPSAPVTLVSRQHATPAVMAHDGGRGSPRPTIMPRARSKRHSPARARA